MRMISAALEHAKRLGTPLESGLTAEAVAKSQAEHGKNVLPEIEGRSIWEIFVASLNDKTLLILIGAAFLSLGVELIQDRVNPAHTPHYIDGIAILVAVMIASLVTTINEARAAKEFRALSKVRDDILVKVLRGGKVTRVSTFDLAVGDIVHFEQGDRIAADGVMLGGVEVEIDQSSLTGESVPAAKNDMDFSLRASTTVVEGNGLMLIEQVGEKTEMGRVQASLTETEEGPTPLQERLGDLADKIGLFGLGAAILTFSALAISGWVRGTLPFALSLNVASELLEFLIIAVTIIVVAVPEGLPLAVTISLAYSVQKMAQGNNLVRRLASCETMGAATVICSDKTGTLTRNRMTVLGGIVGGERFEDVSDLSAIGPAGDALVEIGSVNSTAFLSDDEAGRFIGNPTEGAILDRFERWGVDWLSMRDQAPILAQLGFNSGRKRMTTLVERDDGWQLLVKGAPEVLLERSTTARTADGQKPIGDIRGKIEATLEEYATAGHRTLAFASRQLPRGDLPVSLGALEENLEFVGLFAIADPIRPEVSDAVRDCRRAGVDVKVITGDNVLTARTIAGQVGLLGDSEEALDAEEFRALDEDALAKRLPSLSVLARSRPEDKLRLVNALKANGEVVAVTGDGTNDAPALHAADVGFSMGISGTEIAKEASDIVILDDNFASIVNGIKWGRSIFENIRKFLQFQLTVNVVALVTAFLAAVLGFGIPLNTVQLLWVNLIMDTMAALALATEPPGEELLRQPPHGRHAPLITRQMWIHILTMGTVMVAVLFVALSTDLLVPTTASTATRATFVFNAFVMMQIFNEINARSTRFDRGVWKHFFDSHLFMFVLVVTVAVQVLIIQFGGAFFRTVPLNLELWLKSIAVGASMLLVGVLLRSAGRAFRWGQAEARAA